MVNDILTSHEVAELLGADSAQIRAEIRSGRLEAVKVGRQWRIPKTNLQDWCDRVFGENVIDIETLPESRALLNEDEVITILVELGLDPDEHLTEIRERAGAQIGQRGHHA